MTDNKDEAIKPAIAAADPQEETNSSRSNKRRMSASEYQKYIIMEHHDNMEVDAQGNPHPADEEPAMLVRLPSWLLISETQTKSTDDEEQQSHENYVNMEKQQQEVQEQYVHKPSRCQRWKAEFCDLFRELVNYGINKSWKKKVLTVLVCSSSFLVFADLLFFGNIVNWLQAFILWMGNNIVAGIFAFIGIFVITTRMCTCSLFVVAGVRVCRSLNPL